MCARRLTGRNVINGTCFSLVQVNRFHADRKNVRCFSYERGENFQVKMVEVQLEMSFLRRGNFYCVGFRRRHNLKESHGLKQLLLC